MKESSKLFDLLRQYAHNQSYGSALDDMLSYFLIPFKIYDDEKERAASFDKIANYERREQLFSLLAEIGELSEGFEDLLANCTEC